MALTALGSDSAFAAYAYASIHFAGTQRVVDASAPAGGDGSWDAPYTSITAALTGIAPSTLVYVKAGTYAENVVMPTVDNLAIWGAGPGLTILAGTGAGDTFNWTLIAASPSISRFTLGNLSVLNTSAAAGDVAIRMDGNLQLPVAANNPPNTFGTGLIRFRNVVVTRSGNAAGNCAFFRRVGFVLADNCPWLGSGATGTTTCVNVSQFEFRGYSLVSAWDCTYNRTLPQPFGGRTAYQLEDGTIVGGTIGLHGQVLYVGEGTTQARGFAGAPAFLGSGLTTINGAAGFGPSIAPIVAHQGGVGLFTVAGSGIVTLPMPAIPSLAEIPIVDFSRAQFSLPLAAPVGAVTITCAGAFAGAVRMPVIFQQTRFGLFDATGAAPAPGAVPVSLNCAFDVRQAFYPGQTIFGVVAGVLAGTLDRSSWFHNGVAGSVGVGAGVVLTIPYPAGATYNVATEANTLSATAITAKLVTGFTQQTALVATTLNFTLTRT